MNTTRASLASIGILIALTVSSVAEVRPPIFRETTEWIIVSGFRDFGKGPVPWTYAIKKSSVKSVTMWTDDSSREANAASKSTQHESALPDDAQLLAMIGITTDELATGGSNKRYEVNGLTNGSAPAMFEKILGAASKPATTGATK